MRREKRLWVACNKFGPFSSNFPSCHSPREVVDFSVIHGFMKNELNIFFFFL